MNRWIIAATAAVVAASAPALAADYAPIDCAKAGSAAQRTICGNYTLGQAEARMATLFGIATSLVAMGQRGDLRDSQRRWLNERDACGRNVACLTNGYRVRIGELSKVIDDIASRGPF